MSDDGQTLHASRAAHCNGYLPVRGLIGRVIFVFAMRVLLSTGPIVGAKCNRLLPIREGLFAIRFHVEPSRLSTLLRIGRERRKKTGSDGTGKRCWRGGERRSDVPLEGVPSAVQGSPPGLPRPLFLLMRTLARCARNSFALCVVQLHPVLFHALSAALGRCT
jgi:hypothetical protein